MNIYRNPQSGALLEAPGYIPAIDGIRGLAILAVVAFHAFPGLLPGGFIGVDMFFVVSGYLITRNIAGDVEEKRFSFARFYRHRVRRLFPALAVVLTAVLVAGWLVLLDHEYVQLGKHAAGSVLFASNLLLWRESGYFDISSSAKPLLHLWSLGIEEQFYIVWPILLIGCHRLKIGWRIVIPALTLASFIFSVFITPRDPVEAFYSPLSRFWELGAGGLLALSQRSLATSWQANRRPLALAGGLLIVIGLFLAAGEHGFPGWVALLPVAGSALLVASRPAVLEHRLLVTTGLISYPLYLWHWPLLSFSFIVGGGESPWQLRLALVAISMLLAWATWRLVEIPLRFRMRIGPAPLVAWLAALGVAGAVAYSTNGFEPVRRSMFPAAATLEPELSWPYATTPGCNEAYPFDALDSVAFWFCATNRLAPPTVAVLGNSFANDIFPGLSAALPEETILNVGACFPIRGVRWVYDEAMSGHPCTGDNALSSERFIESLIAGNPTIRTAILHATWPSFDPGRALGSFVSDADPGLDSRHAFASGLRALVAELRQRDMRVILVLPRPALSYDIGACFDRALIGPVRDCVIDREEQYRIHDEVRADLIALAAADPLVDVVDPYDVFCDARTCGFLENGRPLLRDTTGHLTALGSARLARMLAERIVN